MRRNKFGEVAKQLKAIYEDLADYPLPPEAPPKNPSYLDSPEPTPMWALKDQLLANIGVAEERAEELESRLDERNG